MNESKLYKVLVSMLRPIIKTLYRLEIKGVENIPKTNKAILCPNHTSNIDPVLLGISVPRQIFFMAKKELFSNKILSKFFKTLGAFPVNRGAGDSSALEQAEKILTSDKLLGLFIEGTRSKNGEFLRPKTGASLIACHTKSEIIPICIRCIDGGTVRPFKKNVVSIGKPLSIEKLNLTTPSGRAFRDASRTIMDNIKLLCPNNK